MIDLDKKVVQGLRRLARNEASRRYRARYPEKVRETDRRCIRHLDPVKKRISHNRAEARRRQIRRDILARAKDRPCYDCKVRYPKCAMDFDHVEGQKRFDISMGIGKAIHILIAEIEKCEVVCANCHRIREWRRSENKSCTS